MVLDQLVVLQRMVTMMVKFIRTMQRRSPARR